MSLMFGVLLAFSYLCGSIPFGKIMGRLYGVDIQKHGSRNIGFANAVRVLGWRPGLIVLGGDVLKGYVPVIIAQHSLSGGEVLAVGAAALAGHIFPVWLRFRGGKGIATGLGITLALSPLLGALGLLLYLACVGIFRRSAPSSIIATLSLPLLCLAFEPRYTLFFAGLALVCLWTHRTNLRQLHRKTVHAG